MIVMYYNDVVWNAFKNYIEIYKYVKFIILNYYVFIIKFLFYKLYL